MIRIALNIICKDESHVINDLLTSVKPVIDLIVAVDTGSTDNTIELIREFGKTHSIPTTVFERPFDNFCNSRNYALDKLLEVAREQNWNLHDSWGLSIDCDETLLLSERFSKDQLTKDLYEVIVTEEGISYNKRLIFRLSIDFRWESPVHELITWKDPDVKTGVAEHLYIHAQHTGSSWKGGLEKKYLNYARLLTAYIEEGHTDFRTLYNTARAFLDAAADCQSPERRREHSLTAQKYLSLATQVQGISKEERILLYQSTASNMLELEEPWSDVQEILLNAYNLQMVRGETISMIIDHYMEERHWNTAYIFSYFAEKNYNGKNPAGKIGGKISARLYQWEFLLQHTICSYMSGHRQNAKLLRDKLKAYLDKHFDSLKTIEILKIQSSKISTLKIKYWIQRLFFSSPRSF